MDTNKNSLKINIQNHMKKYEELRKYYGQKNKNNNVNECSNNKKS